jgi:hypothetical protein
MNLYSLKPKTDGVATFLRGRFENLLGVAL